MLENELFVNETRIFYAGRKGAGPLPPQCDERVEMLMEVWMLRE